MTQRQGTLPESETIGQATGEMIEVLAPWGISILLHLGMVLIAVFLVWTTVQEQPVEEAGDISISVGHDQGPALKGVLPGDLSPSSLATRGDVRPQVGPRLSGASSRQIGAIGLREGAGLGSSSGEGAASDGDQPGGGLGAGWGGEGLGRGGKGSPFGSLQTMTSGVPDASLWTAHGKARKILYLIDASGSLIDTLPLVISELQHSIARLGADQQFIVIFFQQNEAIEVPPLGWKAATAENKVCTSAWIDPAVGHIVPKGATNPLKGLKLAFRYQPELMFLLSDDITGRGPYELDRAQLLETIQEANSHHTRINTIQFVYPDRLAIHGGPATLELISRTSNGKYHFLGARDLGLE